MKKVILSFVTCVLFANLHAAEKVDVGLRVMSFNMRYAFKEKKPEYEWKNRKSIVAEVINDHQPDILGSQELSPQQVIELKELIPGYASFGMGREVDKKGESSGESMIIFYKTAVLKLLEKDSFWLSDTPRVPESRTWGEAWIRTMTWGKFAHIKSNQTFYFFNTHLDTKRGAVHEKECEFIAKTIKEVAGESPLFLVADFNSDGDKGVEWEFFKKESFKDARVSSESEPSGSYGTGSKFRAPHKNVSKQKRIDWILFKGDMSVKDYATINYHNEGNYPSDHFPVMSNVVISYTKNLSAKDK